MGRKEATIVRKIRYIYWQEGSFWFGYLQDYPDYWTQGESFDDLKAHLKDLYRGVTSVKIPGIRKVGELAV
jgi:predicted RNase H-like HicB family nuclease